MSEERQTNYTIAEGYELPSGGIIYDANVNKLVELRSMTARDEMKRMSPSVVKFKPQCDIIEGCMLEKPAVHVYDMALGDYEYLLHKLRIVTYGSSYKIICNCPHCGEQVEVIADLETLTVKDFDQAKFDELRSFKLPKSGDSVTIKFQTPRMLDEAIGKAKDLKKRFKDADINFEEFVVLTQVIDTINGATLDSTRLEAYINKMPAADMIKVLNKLSELNNSIGLNSKLDVECPECAGEFQTFFRFGQEFFRPTTI